MGSAETCEGCLTNHATLGCLMCRRNLCSDCFEKDMLTLSDDMEEGFAGPLQLKARF
jgi:hypothetical protein